CSAWDSSLSTWLF
nr:immunoglobulin light chain junction region [Macaca mulatta]